MLWLRRFIKNNRGQTLVEFALLLPVLLLILGGMIDFGLVYHEQLVMTAAAREGARVAVVNGDGKTAAETYARNASIRPSTVQATVSFTTQTGTTEKTVVVTVTNPVPILFPMMDMFFNGKSGYDAAESLYTVAGKAIMRVE
jgi:Flp pilus assembly protein TadG